MGCVGKDEFGGKLAAYAGYITRLFSPFKVTTAEIKIINSAKIKTEMEELNAVSDALRTISSKPSIQNVDVGLQASHARRKRKEKMRGTIELLAPSENDEANAYSRVPPKKRKVIPSGKGKIRTQIRYNPDVPISKEETTQ